MSVPSSTLSGAYVLCCVVLAEGCPSVATFKMGGLPPVLKRPRLDTSIHDCGSPTHSEALQTCGDPRGAGEAASPNPSGSLLPTFIVDLPVSVNISFPDHFVHFFIRQLLAKVRHHMAQLGGADVAVPVLEGEKLSSG